MFCTKHTKIVIVEYDNYKDMNIKVTKVDKDKYLLVCVVVVAVVKPTLIIATEKKRQKT